MEGGSDGKKGRRVEGEGKEVEPRQGPLLLRPQRTWVGFCSRLSSCPVWSMKPVPLCAYQNLREQGGNSDLKASASASCCGLGSLVSSL